MNKFRLVFIFLFAAISCGGCISRVTGTISADINPTQTSVAESTPTQIASSQPPPSSTLDPYSQVLPSPDGLFIAKLYSIYQNSSYIEAVEIWDSEGDLVINIPYQGETNQGDPQDSMRIADWSSDSSKLFFYYSWAYDGWITLFNGSNLQYYDVPTGEIKELVPGIVSFEFSHDRSHLAYLTCCEVIILNLMSGVKTVREIPDIEHSQAGWIHISPSGNKAVYHLLVNEYGGTAVLFDIRSSNQIILFENEFIETIIFEGWDDDENPLIKYVDSDNNWVEINSNNHWKKCITRAPSGLCGSVAQVKSGYLRRVSSTGRWLDDKDEYLNYLYAFRG
jgi:hypothetical protein